MDETFDEGRYTSQDGLSLYYRDYKPTENRDTPLLCLPGLTRNSRDFHVFACRHRGTRRVICPDFRGRGKSDRTADPMMYDGPYTVDDLRHLLALLDLHHFVVVGTSFGGLITMALGVAMPTIFEAAVLNDVGPDLGTEGLDKIRAYLSQDVVLDDWDQAIALMKRNFPRETIGNPGDWRHIAEGTFEQRDDGKLHYSFDRNLIKLFDPRPEGPPDLWAMFRSLVDIPTLVIRGADSEVLFADTLERMAEAHPKLEQITQPDCGHPPLLNEPLVEPILDAFIARY